MYRTTFATIFRRTFLQLFALLVFFHFGYARAAQDDGANAATQSTPTAENGAVQPAIPDEIDRESGRASSFLLRNRNDGAVEVVANGAVMAVFPPGYFIVGMPNAEAVQREKRRREALDEQEQAETERIQKEAQELAEADAEAAKKKKLEDEAREKDAAERAALAEDAVTLFNGMTGDSVRVVPLDVVVEKLSAQERQLKGAAAEKKAQQRAAIEEKAVTIFDGMSGLYVQAVPVEALTNPGDSKER